MYHEAKLFIQIYVRHSYVYLTYLRYKINDKITDHRIKISSRLMLFPVVSSFKTRNSEMCGVNVTHRDRPGGGRDKHSDDHRNPPCPLAEE